ncbi:MAG: hypothetical protein LBI18_03450 [Planctomycetaceae bacterium]|nr:hypothetical protein [Planctomycetaceae bacterium]
MPTSKVGDVSPKHHVGVSRPASVFGLQFVLPNGLESDCQPTTEAVMFRRNITHQIDVGDSRLDPVCRKLSQRWVKTLRRNITYLWSRPI